MNRNQIAEDQCAHKLFMADAHLFCVFNHRDRHGNALISTSRINHNWIKTAAHPRIASGRRHGACSDLHVIAVVFHKVGANGYAVLLLHALLRNSFVIFNLAVDQLLNILHLNLIRKCQNIKDIQAASVRQGFVKAARLIRFFVQSKTVFLDSHQIGMLMYQFHLCFMAITHPGNSHMQVRRGLHNPDFTEIAVFKQFFR